MSLKKTWTTWCRERGVPSACRLAPQQREAKSTFARHQTENVEPQREQRAGGQRHTITRSAWQTQGFSTGLCRCKTEKSRQRSRRRKQQLQKSRRRHELIAGMRVRRRRACTDTIEETSSDEDLVLRPNLRSKRESQNYTVSHVQQH